MHAVSATDVRMYVMYCIGGNFRGMKFLKKAQKQDFCILVISL